MSGPRPMNQPPGYGPQYQQQPMGQPQQYPPYPQKKGSSGIMKGCIIAFVVIFLLGGIIAVVAGAGVWFAAKGITEGLDKDVDEAVAISDDFMKKLAAGDTKGALALTEGISEELLADYSQRYAKYLKDNKGLSYNTHEVLGVKVRGNVSVVNGEGWITLLPADLKEQKGVQVVIQLHKPSGGNYKISYVTITGASGVEGSATIGTERAPRSNNSSSGSKWD